jgi:hypothetical protein
VSKPQGLSLAAGAAKEYFWGCIKSIPPLAAAKENFEWTPLFIISLCEMMNNGVHSKQLLAVLAANEGLWPFHTAPKFYVVV